MFKRLRWSKPAAITRYGVAIVSIGLSVLISEFLDSRWKSAPFVSVFTCAIVLSAWFGGFGPGLLSVALSILAFDYYFLPPTHSLLPNSNEVPRLILFAVAALLVGLLSSAQRGSAESLRRARDTLALKVQELERAIVERNQAQDALHKAQAELAHMTRLTTMGELTASIAHEVNQPLAGVVTNANAGLRWLAGPSPDLNEAREALRRILRDGNRASDVIARIRTLLKKGETDRRRLDVNRVIDEMVELTRREVRQRNVLLKTELSANLPPITADRVQLQQVLLNLIINAAEAMSANKDRPRLLLIRSEHVQPSAVRVAVQDTGVGIDSQQVERLFDAFYTTKPNGLGMGLAICRSIIEAHGGRLWAVPNDGPGATFEFSLPTEQETKNDAAKPEC
ncbi:MAG TPA: ATP-binding protein [Verrucomicrobiae bacterium]|nr:ATP-binding protein [Verrucomicrobiae bacterium]